jgi:hypothetical protein
VSKDLITRFLSELWVDLRLCVVEVAASMGESREARLVCSAVPLQLVL